MQERITTNTFGYNVDTASAPRQASIQRCKDSKASFHTIMVDSHGDFPSPTSANTVWEYYEALKDTVDDLILLVRFYSNRETNWRDYPDRTRWANALKDVQLPPNTYIDSRCNEPSLNGADLRTNQEYVQWEIKNIEAVANAGHRYAVGAFSTGTPHESLIYGVYDDLWRAVDDNGGAIDMHLYGVYPLEAGETHPYELALNPSAIRSIFENPTRWTDYFGWLVGRYFQVDEAYEAVNGEKPLFLVAETLLDRVMPDPYNSQWKSKFGMPQYQNDNRGLMSWERVMKEAFPELSFVQIIEKLLIHVRDNILYGDNIRMSLFADNPQWNNYDWSTHKYSGHDIGDASLINLHTQGLARVNTYPVYIDSEKEQPMEPIPDITPDMYTMLDAKITTSKGGTNIRNERSATSSEVIALQTGQEIIAKISDQDLWSGIGWSWKRVEYNHPNSDTSEWWVAWEKNGVRSNVQVEYIDPPATEEPSDPDYSALVQQLHTMQEQLDAYEEALDAVVADHAKELEDVIIDIPLPSFTMTIRKVDQERVADEYENVGKLYLAMSQRIRSGVLSPQQMADITFAVAEFDEDDVFSNVSAEGNDSLVNEIMNGDIDLPLASGE